MIRSITAGFCGPRHRLAHTGEALVGRSGFVRRCAVWVALAVMPALLAVEPVLAERTAEPPPSGVPTLSLPEVETPLPARPTTADGTLSVPADADEALPESSRRLKAELPEASHEVVSERDAVTEVWENTDGTQTVTIHGEPVHYQPDGSSAWQAVDNSLVAVAGRAGWVENAANDWSVRFGPVQPGGVGGVELVTDAGPVRFVPELAAGHAAVAPVVGSGDEADTVTYPDVWPGVDVKYTVSGGAVREDIVVDSATRASFPFVVEGLGLTESTESADTPAVEVTGAQVGDVVVLSPEVFDTAGEAADGEADPDLGVVAAATTGRGAVVDSVTVPGAPQRLTVAVDSEWLGDELAASDEAVVIDPTMAVVSNSLHSSYKSDGAVFNQDGIRVGNSQGGTGGSDTHWRSGAAFPYWSHISGKQVLYAGVWMNRDLGTVTAQPVYGWWACGGTYADATCNNDTERRFATQTGVTDGSVALDFTNLVKFWEDFGVQSGAFGFSSAETPGSYTYKKFQAPSLVLNVNSAPTVPGLVAPANDSLAITSVTPTLKWGTATDADGDTVKYTAKISTGSDGESGLVATGPEGTGTSWQVPAGVLRDGVTYYWAVWANDGNAWTKSAVRRLTVDRAGVSPPGDDFAGVSTNLITGASSLSVPGVSLPTVGGGVGVSFSYDSKAPVGGLRGEYRADDDEDHVIESSDPLVLVRDDPQLSFSWAGPTGSGTTSTSPSPGVPAQNFTVTWTGQIAIPSGTWKLGARSDDGVRVYLDDSTTPVVDSWVSAAMPATPVYQSGTVSTDMHKIKVEYYQAAGASGIELWAKDTSTTPATELVVPAGWLSATTRVLPAGWRLEASDGGAEYQRAEVSEGSVTLFRPDGTALAFPRTAFGLGYTPPKGIEDVVVVNADGTITVQADSGVTYLFNEDGTLNDYRAAIDEGDADPAATVPAYDAAGRLETMTDPVSDQQVTLHYAPDAACQEDPPVLGGSEYGPIPTGMLCKVSYWDNTATYLYYKNNLLAYVRNPGDAYWGLSYNANGRLAGYHDPTAYDAAISGARSDWDKLLVEVAYDTAGRASTITQQPPLQGDPRPAVTYGYAPTLNAHGELIGGTATVTRAGVTGTYRSVAYDSRGRGTSETDAAGLISTSTWNSDDEVIRTDDPGGLRSTTFYDQESQPFKEYGPAPASLFNADGTGQPSVPRTLTNYDEGINGLAVSWWPNTTFAGLPTIHQHDPGTLDSDWGTGSPASSIPADNFAGRYTGEIVFPSPGTYTFRFERDLKLAVFLDDSILHYEWGNTTPGTSGEVTFATTGMDESHRLRVDFGETTGSAKLKMQWKTPGSSTWVTVPANALRTGYGLITSTIDDNTTTTTQYTDSASGLSVVHRVPTSSTLDPAGLALTGSTKYEAGGFRRPVSELMPSGDETGSSYYGNAETRNNPCIAGTEQINQAGLLKYQTAMDPDGSGSDEPIRHEYIYDISGRPVATRIGSDSWTCVTYDARGRIIRVDYPAFGGTPARTVVSSYLVDPDGTGPRVASPLVTSFGDATGTVKVETDLAGGLVSQTDVFDDTTSFTYDPAHRPLTSQGPAGAFERTYDSADRLTGLKRNGQVLANGFVYNASGQLANVSYPSGTGNAGNGTSGSFGYDSFGRPSSVSWTGPGGTALTSDAVSRNLMDQVINEVIDGVDHHPGDDFGYDAAGRLTDAWLPGAKYEYDFYVNGFCSAPDSYKNGNRTLSTITPTGGSATSTAYCYDHADRLTATTDSSVGAIAYDSHGNVTSVFDESHTYDASDRHLSTIKAGTTVTYARDAADRIVERRVNGMPVARYGYTGSDDAPSFATDGAGTVTSVTYSLPGGALLSTGIGTDDTWSYPNVHGDIVATADQAGAKLGQTVRYDPYGNLVAGAIPDNSQGNMDNAWLGEHQRPLEHEPSLQPIIEMGARQYSSLLGRFLEVDPILGGSCNAYDYACGDPVNQADITGKKYSPVYLRYEKSWKIVTSVRLYVGRNATKWINAFLRNNVDETLAALAGICVIAAAANAAAGIVCTVMSIAGYLTVRAWLYNAARKNACATVDWGWKSSWLVIWRSNNGSQCYTRGSSYRWKEGIDG